MQTIDHTYALLLSTESPVFKAALEINRDKISDNKVYKYLFGVEFNTIQKWIAVHGRNNPGPKTIRRLCDHYNFICKQEEQLKAIYKPLIPELFDSNEKQRSTDKTIAIGYEAPWFNFSKYLGYKDCQWQDVQDHIETVLIKHGQRGRETSCSPENADQIIKDIGGLNIVYFKTMPAAIAEQVNSNTKQHSYMQRATLRIRDPISPYNSICCVPCRLKVLTPSQSSDDETLVEYSGNATFQNGFVYITLIDQFNTANDVVQIVIDTQKPFEKRYSGLYTSISANKIPYCSSLVVENMRRRLPNNFLASRKCTLDFMYRTLRVFRGGNNKPDIFTKSIGDSYDSEIEETVGCEYLSASESNKKWIETQLGDSPFHQGV